MTRKHSGYSLRFDPIQEVWYVCAWNQVTELAVHSEAVTEDFNSFQEAQAALKDLEGR